MQLKEIKELMKEFSRSAATELYVKDGDFEIRLRKKQPKILMNPASVVSVEQQASVYDAPAFSFSESAVSAVEEKASTDAEMKTGYFELKSPLVGIYHKAPAPDAEPFVKEGDHVNEGDEVAIVEAMKMMNHISSPVSGKVISIKAEEGELVDYDQIIMEIAES